MNNTQETLEMPVIRSFMDGFSTVTRKPYLILFPLALDVFLLFAPKLKVTHLFGTVLDNIAIPTLAEPLLEQWQAVVTVLREFLQHFSLTSFLRVVPLGVPSLFSTRIFEKTLLPNIPSYEMGSFWQVSLFVFLFFTFGTIATLGYYSLIEHKLVKETPLKSINQYAKNFISFFLIPPVFFFAATGFILPSSCVVSFFTVISPALGSLFYFGVIFVFLYLILPVLFTPHVIIRHGKSLKESIRYSWLAIRPVRGKATLFLAAGVGLSYLTNLLWNLPKDGSWFLVAGAFGHAIIATIVLAASFHFFYHAELKLEKSDQISNQLNKLA